MYKKGPTFLAFLAFLVLSFPSICRAETVDGIVAVVDGDIITSSELDIAMTQYQKEARGATDRKNETLRREVLDKMIDDLLLKHSIEKAKITVEDDELARAIANILRQNKMTPEALRAEVASKGVSYEAYKKNIADQIRVIKFTNQIIGQQVKLTDREERNYYDRNKDKFGGASFESVKDKIYDILYEERAEEALKNYLFQQRQKAYIDIR